jgi:hypothetical protein
LEDVHFNNEVLRWLNRKYVMSWQVLLMRPPSTGVAVLGSTLTPKRAV